MQEVLLKRTPRSRHRAFQIKDYVIEIDHTFLDKRAKRELPRGRVAPRASHKPRRLYFLPVEFGQTVDRLLLLLQRRVFVAVPFRILFGIAKSEVGR